MNEILRSFQEGGNLNILKHEVAEGIYAISVHDPLPQTVSLVDADGAEIATLPVSLSRLFFDMFGRLRVSEPRMLVKSSYTFDSESEIWDDQAVSGGGTASAHDATRACMTLSVSALTAGERRRQMFQPATYQPGKSQLVEMTGTMGAHVAGVIKEYGIGDELNALGWSSTGSDVAPFKRSGVSGSTVTTRVARADWTHDKLDGTGPSGYTLDVTAGQIWWCAFEWLGVGDIFFGVIIGAEYILCHHMKHANIFTGGGAYISNPNLPPMCRIVADGTNATGASMTQVCCTVISEGGQDLAGIDAPISRGATPLTTHNDSDWYPIFAIRARQRGVALSLNNVHIVCPTNSLFEVGIFINPTVTGTAFSYTQVRSLPIEADASRTSGTKISGGIPVYIGTSQSSAGSDASFAETLESTRVRAGYNIAGTFDVVVVGVRRLTGTTESFYGSVGIHVG